MHAYSKPSTAILLLLVSLFISSCTIRKIVRTNDKQAGRAGSGPLYNEIAHEDSLLFDAFNNRDIEKLKKFLDPGLELYQDNIGVRNYEETIEAFTNLFKNNNVLTRKLVPGTMEVYPIKGYGAIETGEHTFSHLEDGRLQAATFKFMHIWHKQDGAWRITRLVTYDHPEVWK